MNKTVLARLIKLNKTIKSLEIQECIELLEKESSPSRVVAAAPELLAGAAEFFRYYRPHHSGTPEGSKTGITFLIRLDYVLRQVHFTFAVCNGDNFSKSVGRARCRARCLERFEDHGYYATAMPNNISPNGIVQDVIVPALRAVVAERKDRFASSALNMMYLD